MVALPDITVIINVMSPWLIQRSGNAIKSYWSFTADGEMQLRAPAIQRDNDSAIICVGKLNYVFPFLHMRADLSLQVDAKITEASLKLRLPIGHMHNNF
jgi:hypothetical protein